MEIPWHKAVITEHFSGSGWRVTHPSQTISESRYSERGKKEILVQVERAGSKFKARVVPSHNENVIGIEIGTRGGIRPPAARWIYYEDPSHKEQAESAAKKLSDLIKGR